MKKILFLIGIVVAASLLYPKIVGLSVASSLEEIANNINSSEAQTGFSIRVNNVDTEWFSTTADVLVEYDPYLVTALNFDVLSYELMITVQHGPFLTLDKFGLGRLAFTAEIDKSLARDTLQYSDAKTLYSLEGHISLLGTIYYTDTIPAFAFIEEEGASLRFGGWNGQGKSTLLQLSYQGELNSMTGTLTDEIKFRIKPISIEFTTDHSSDNYFPDFYGDTSLEIIAEYIRFGSDSIEPLEIRNLIVGSNQEIKQDNELMDIGFDFSIASVLFPGFSAEDFLLKTKIKNLHVETLKELPSNLDLDAPLQQNFDYLPLLQASPELITEISGVTTKGRVSGQVLMRLSGISSLPTDLDNEAFWLSKTIIDSKLVLEEALASWITEEFSIIDQNLLESMFTKTSDGNYEFKLTLKDSEFILNGNLIPL